MWIFPSLAFVGLPPGIVSLFGFHYSCSSACYVPQKILLPAPNRKCRSFVCRCEVASERDPLLYDQSRTGGRRLSMEQARAGPMLQARSGSMEQARAGPMLQARSGSMEQVRAGPMLQARSGSMEQAPVRRGSWMGLLMWLLGSSSGYLCALPCSGWLK